MQLEQAIFTSAQTSRARGYHLVARSAGIDDRLAQQLALWAPSENSLIDRDVNADSLNVFPLDDGWIVVSRTIYAGAEYSDRGQFRMETNFLAMQRSQFAGYDFNPIAVARMALASGYLRLREALPTSLQPVSLPMSRPSAATDDDSHLGDERLIQNIVQRYQGERVVIVGCRHPWLLLQNTLQRLPGDRRLDLSFSTGLKPSMHRPFRVQFLPEVNDDLAREMAARGMSCLMA